MKRRLIPADVIDALTDLFILRGVPAFIRSDNGPEFIAQADRDWIAAVGARTACIEPGSPWDGGGSESSPGDCFPDDGLLRKRLGKADAAGEDARERV